MKKAQNMKLKVIPIGGLGLIGMNITAFEYNDSIIIVDCGMAFPENDMLGMFARLDGLLYRSFESFRVQIRNKIRTDLHKVYILPVFI